MVAIVVHKRTLFLHLLYAVNIFNPTKLGFQFFSVDANESKFDIPTNISDTERLVILGGRSGVVFFTSNNFNEISYDY